MMERGLVRVEGVNFDATLFDTDDLSTIRGGSLTLLALGVWALYLLKHSLRENGLQENGGAVEEIFSGASQGAFLVACPVGLSLDALSTKLRRDITHTPTDSEWQEACTLASLPDPGQGHPLPAFAHLTTVVDAVAFAGHASSVQGQEAQEREKALELALEQAAARNHSRQFRQWTVDPLPMETTAQDGGRLERHGRPGTVKDSGQTKVSRAVHAKRLYGRHARQTLYDWELRDLDNPLRDRFCVTDNFQDIVNLSCVPTGADGSLPTIPLSARGKIAVFYADGNSFGAVKRAVGTRVFSDRLKGLRRNLLRALLQWFCDHAADPCLGSLFAVAGKKESDTRALRFETLLWGGDEVMFVVPAWLALSFAAEFDRLSQGWSIEDANNDAPDGRKPLSHAMGLVIAHHKTPIRHMRNLAKAVADGAKVAGLKDRNTVTVEIFESQTLPDRIEDLDPLRKTLYGSPPDGQTLAGLLALPGGEALRDRLRGLVNLRDHFPRGQLYAALRQALSHGDSLAQPSNALENSLQTYADRVGRDLSQDLWQHILPACGDGRSKALDVALLCKLWDYAPIDMT